jgi:hypothetical protein
MVTTSDVKAYLKDRLTFVGQVLEFTTVGGIAGGVTGGILSYLDNIPLVQSAPKEVGFLGALFGFAVVFVKRALS